MLYPIVSANRPKVAAKKLRAHLAAAGERMSLGACLDLVSRAYGYKDWNALSSSIPDQIEAQPAPELVARSRRHAVSVLSKAGLGASAEEIIDDVGLFGRAGGDGSTEARDMCVYRELARVPFLKGPRREALASTFGYLAGRGHDLWEFAALLRGSAVDALASVDRESLRSGLYKRSWGFVDAVWFERMARICSRACSDSLAMRSEPGLFDALGMGWATLATRDGDLLQSVEALKAAHRAGGTMAHLIAFHAHGTGFGLRRGAFVGGDRDYLVEACERDTTRLQTHSGLGRMLLDATPARRVLGRDGLEDLNETVLRLFAFGDDITYSFNIVVASMLGVDHLIEVSDMGARSDAWRQLGFLVPTSRARGRVGAGERFVDIHGVHTLESLPSHLGIAPDEIRLKRVAVEPIDEDDFGDQEPPSFLRAVALCLPWIERLCPADARHPATVDRVVLLWNLVSVYRRGSTMHSMGVDDSSTWNALVERSLEGATGVAG